MTELPTRDEIVERVQGALIRDQFRSDIMPSETALDAFTVADLLAMLKMRGCEVDLSGRTETRAQLFTVVLPAERPDA